MTIVSQRPWTGRPLRSSRPLRTLALLTTATAGVVVMDPQHTHVPLCPFKATTGWDCPFCGGLRCVNSMAHGQLGAAVHDNILLVLATPVIALLWLDWFYRERTGRPPRFVHHRRALTIASIVVLTAFTIVRNLPSMQFLRPA